MIPSNYLESLLYLEIETDEDKKFWMSFLEKVIHDSLEDHFYEVKSNICCCPKEKHPKYILIIPDKYRSDASLILLILFLLSSKIEN